MRSSLPASDDLKKKSAATQTTGQVIVIPTTKTSGSAFRAVQLDSNMLGKSMGQLRSTKSANCCHQCCHEALLVDFRWWTYRLKSLILFGSPGRIRTSDQPVNSRLLYH